MSSYPFRVTTFGHEGVPGELPTLTATVSFDSAVELYVTARPPVAEGKGWSLEIQNESVTPRTAAERAANDRARYLHRHGAEFIALLLAAHEDERINLPPFDLQPAEPRRPRAFGLMADVEGGL